jgi:glycine betaine/proline transport system substrate-binding protein
MVGRALVTLGVTLGLLGTAGAPGGAQDAGTVRIAVNAWTGYEADYAVVADLLKSQLGYTVQRVDVDEYIAWQGFETGEVDAILEIWGHDAERATYIDEKGVAQDAGLMGVTGVIGWFVPGWMAEEYPDITDWRNLDRYAPLFRTARSGKRGQFLAGDPSFVTNDAALIANLRLDYTVVHAGSEDRLISAFRRAEADRTPLLGYFYEPQWLLAELDLVHIPLPRHRAGCDADPKTVACDYPAYLLDKVGRTGFLRSGSPAVELIENFRWTNADQNAVARDLTVKGLSPDEAARRWLAAHPDVWRKWLP